MTCSIPECPRSAIARGWCHTHYEHWRTYGDPLPRPRSTPRDRLLTQVEHGRIFEGTPCWEWQGKRLPNGYGALSVDNQREYTHRLAWKLFRGPIPDGFHVDHRCENKACCNPAHLEPVAPIINTRRHFSKKTHCPAGHPYENGRRGRCRVCDRERARARYARKKASA